jgi:ferrous iron transport protein A
MMPLTMAETGKNFPIKRITGRDNTKKFLESLGFVIGSEITIISENGGNIIVKVKDSRIAIDKTMANKIMV